MISLRAGIWILSPIVKVMAKPFDVMQWKATSPPLDRRETELECSIGNLRFKSADGEFAIWSAKTSSTDLVVKGPLANVNTGESLTCRGHWANHHRYGWSFQVSSFQSQLPSSRQGVQAWLEAKIPGVGPAFAKAIVNHFGAKDVYKTLDQDPSRMREVRTARGRTIPDKQIDKAIDAWHANKTIRMIETFLLSLGVSVNRAGKLYRHYGNDTFDVLKHDPYRITEIDGIGFKLADHIALAQDMPFDDPKRIGEGILFTLSQTRGHVFLSLDQLTESAQSVLEINEQTKIIKAASELSKSKRIVVEEDELRQQRIYLTDLHRMEVELARSVRSLLGKPVSALFEMPKERLMLGGHHPTEDQLRSIDMVRNHRLSLLTGNPGVGKTAIIHILVGIMRNRSVKLCAPTGKAARRLSELTGHPATTIHRLLEYSPKGHRFLRNALNPIDADCIVIDESSMLSLDLAVWFFRAIREGTHVLLVGDPDQLPSVGVGKVMDDLICTEAVPSVHLDKIFRQAAKSMIVQNARRVNQGKLPYLKHAEAQASAGLKMREDYYWVGRSSPESTFEMVIDSVVNKLPSMYPIDPIKDIQVLAPMHKGKVGIEEINKRLESKLNPTAEDPITKRQIRVGSKVVQTKNDYTPDREVMNGEIAMVEAYDTESEECTLSLDDGERTIRIPKDEMASYRLAWCLSVHKFQGSQARIVVIGLSMSHYPMLSRQLVYTALTRAEKLCIMIGEKKALHAAVGRADTRKRNTTLRERILDPNISGELL